MIPRIPTVPIFVDAHAAAAASESAMTDADPTGSASLHRMSLRVAARGIPVAAPGTPQSSTAMTDVDPLPILPLNIDPAVVCTGSPMPQAVELAIRNAIADTFQRETFASDQAAPYDCRPASPIRGSAATRARFDRYLDPRPQPWDGAKAQQLTQFRLQPIDPRKTIATASQPFNHRVVHVTPAMAERLKLAKCAVDLTRALLCHGPANQIRNVQLHGYDAAERAQCARAEFKQRCGALKEKVTKAQRVHMLAHVAVKWETGRCAEHAALTASILASLPELRDVQIDIVNNSKIDHALVVIRSHNPEEDVVVDAWSVLPVPCLKADASRELGVMALRPSSLDPDAASNRVNTRKAIGTTWPEFDIEAALDARRSLSDVPLNAFHCDPDPSASRRDAQDQFRPFDVPFNGDPMVQYVKLDPASNGSTSSMSANTAFGFRYEHLPNERLSSLSSRSAPSMSATATPSEPTPPALFPDEITSSHPAERGSSAPSDAPMEIDDGEFMRLLDGIEAPSDLRKDTPS